MVEEVFGETPNTTRGTRVLPFPTASFQLKRLPTQALVKDPAKANEGSRTLRYRKNWNLMDAKPQFCV
jgi:hypothetical protein